MLPENLDVWVLAGQSNMEGRGLLADALPPDNNVWSFTMAGKWDIAVDPLQRIWESFTPAHPLRRRTGLPEDQKMLSDDELACMELETGVTGAGPGVSFGKAMAEATGLPVGLIPVACGGTLLEEWSHRRKAEGGMSFYGAMLERIQRAGGNLKGVLWYQGESDTTAEAAPTYGERLDEWICALRSDLGRPDLPIVVVQIGRLVPIPSEMNSWDLVREALRTLPQRLPHIAVTSAIDLGLTDPIHVNSCELIRLGRRMARLANSMMLDPNIPAGPRMIRIERCEPRQNMGEVRVVTSGVTGGWNPRQNISGFEVRTVDGELHPDVMLINAYVDESFPTSIRLLLTAQPDDSVRIGYGLGLNPHCNAVDDADMPLCAFMPTKIADTHQD